MTDHNPDVSERLAKIGQIARDMTTEDRLAATNVFREVMATLALFGADEGLPAALMLGHLVDLMLLTARDERRSTVEVG